MKNIIYALAALFIISGAYSCSKNHTNAAIYESMRSLSNENNARNPNYDPDAVPSYQEYEAQREQYLKDRKEQQDE